MPELDFSNIYSSTGKIIQVQYAQKAADNGSIVIALRGEAGVVLIVSKPITTSLYVQESDRRIKKLCDNAYMAYTGILTDGLFISDICKKAIRDYVSKFNTNPPSEFIKRTLGDYLYIFTQYSSVRVVGANFLTIVNDSGRYRVFSADCSGKVSEYKGFACGSGDRRAQTEIEKLDLDRMSVNDLIDQGVKILFKCHDPLSEPEFTAEVGFISDDSDGEFVRLEKSKVESIMDKYRDISVDEDGE